VFEKQSFGNFEFASYLKYLPKGIKSIIAVKHNNPKRCRILFNMLLAVLVRY